MSFLKYYFNMKSKICLFLCCRLTCTVGHLGPRQIGFVGVGNMGSQMAMRLIERGHKLHIHDISKDALKPIQGLGAIAYGSTAEMIQGCEFVITMLPDSEAVSQVYSEMTNNGIERATIFIDSSTTAPDLSQTIQQLVELRGGRFVDAPASGSVFTASQGTLAFMVGGKKEEYLAVRDILKCMGDHVIHCGGIGMGQVANLCNVMLLSISMIGVAESMNLAISSGLDAQTFAQILNMSTGRCWVSEEYNPVPGVATKAPVNDVLRGGLRTEQVTKGLDMTMNLAIATGATVTMGSMAHQFYRLLKAQGKGKQDISIAYDFIKDKEKIK